MFHSDCVYIQVPLNYDNQSKREGKKLSTYHIRRKQVTKLSLKKKESMLWSVVRKTGEGWCKQAVVIPITSNALTITTITKRL